MTTIPINRGMIILLPISWIFGGRSTKLLLAPCLCFVFFRDWRKTWSCFQKLHRWWRRENCSTVSKMLRGNIPDLFKTIWSSMRPILLSNKIWVSRLLNKIWVSRLQATFLDNATMKKTRTPLEFQAGLFSEWQSQHHRTVNVKNNVTVKYEYHSVIVLGGECRKTQTRQLCARLIPVHIYVCATGLLSWEFLGGSQRLYNTTEQ